MNSEMKKALDEAFEELQALSPKEFGELIDGSTKPYYEKVPELDTVSMLRES